MSAAPVLPSSPSFREVVTLSELTESTPLLVSAGRRSRARFSAGMERPTEVYSAEWPLLSPGEAEELRELVSSVGYTRPVLAAPDGGATLRPYRIAQFEETLEAGDTYSARATLERLYGLPVLTPEE